MTTDESVEVRRALDGALMQPLGGFPFAGDAESGGTLAARAHLVAVAGLVLPAFHAEF